MTSFEVVQIWICVILLMSLALIIGYSIGLKDGQREGYLRGRSVVRHMAGKENSR